MSEAFRVARADRGAATVLATTEGPAVRVTVPHHLTPVVGDWVAVDGDPPAITEIHPRTSMLARASGGSEPQAIAANVDVVGIVVALDTPLRPRRLERALALAWSSGAIPAVVLTKADACDDLPSAIDAARSAALGTQVLPVSSVTGEGLDDVLDLVAGKTVVLLGASGAGKTTLINRLTGSELATAGVRTDGKGRHTTTAGQLVPLPGGGVLLDTPGLKILGVWDDEGVDAAFADIAELAADCRFADCAHESEPGCAVRDAVAPDRLAAWHKLQRELEFVARRSDRMAQVEQKRRNKQFGKLQKAHKNRP